MRTVTAALVLLLLLLTSRAQEQSPKPDTPEQAAEKVLAAFSAKNEAALEALAEKDRPDPWLVADELSRRGRIEVALAFAKAAPRKDVEALPAYLEAWSGSEEETAARAALVKARAERDPEAALMATEPFADPPKSVTGVLLLDFRGTALRRLRRIQGSAEVFLRAARLAVRLGWLRWAMSLYRESGLCFDLWSDYRAALAVWEEGLAVEESRGDIRGRAGVLMEMGISLERLGEMDRALDCHRRALAIFRDLGDVPGEARTLGNIGVVEFTLGRGAPALACFRQALELFEKLGDPREVAGQHANLGGLLQATGDLQGSVEHLDSALRTLSELGDTRGVALCLANLGITYRKMGHLSRAQTVLKSALGVAERLGDRQGIADCLLQLGEVCMAYGDHPRAIVHLERAVGLSGEIGNPATMAYGLRQLGCARERLGSYDEALGLIERSLAIEEKLGNLRGVLASLQCLADLRRECRDSLAALELERRSLELAREMGDRGCLCRALSRFGSAHLSLGDGRTALSFQEQALALAKELGDEDALATVLQNAGIALDRVGDLEGARDAQRRALEILERLGDRAKVGRRLATLGELHALLGDHPEAFGCLERAVGIAKETGDREGLAQARSALGNLYGFLGDRHRALACHAEALAIVEELGNLKWEAQIRGNAAVIHAEHGDHSKAVEEFERARVILGETGDPYGEATAIGNIALCHLKLGQAGAALRHAREFLRLAEELDDRGNVARALLILGKVLLGQGTPEAAAECLSRAVAAAREVGESKVLLMALTSAAKCRLESGDAAGALAAAREAVEELGHVTSGLSEEHAAGSRESFASVYVQGLAAGYALDSLEGVTFFLESGRAGTLLEVLGGREKVQAGLLPPELRSELIRVRSAAAVAGERFSRAVGRGARKEIRAGRAELDRAREEMLAVLERIEREAKASADLVFRRPDTCAEIRSRLGDREAMVLYFSTGMQVVALVLTHERGRLVDLGDAGALREVVGELRLEVPGLDSGSALARLRRLAWEPLAVPPAVTRILVSPHGVLSTVPFATLTDREVCYVPSGTTHGLLLSGRGEAGEGVLALGDPDYVSERDASALVVHRGAANLSPLPATREEAKAVGDVVLLGEEATERKLAETLATRSRWRAVHLACHGLLDTERPTLSSLALSPDPENDGQLTCLEVFRSRILADLAVLSACETARGKVYRAEGVVGLMRAFMYAGAPRVLCSLWKVDDEATKALMVKFYELWNPPPDSGRQALPAATALRQAQEFVKGHEKWKHPFYWAAWVLWGLPD